MQAFVGHLHGFVNEVELTEEEWRQLIRMLTATGDITDERRQEFILWSDTTRRLDAGRRPLPRLPRRGDRVDGARAVLRPRRAAARVRRDDGR